MGVRSKLCLAALACAAILALVCVSVVGIGSPSEAVARLRIRSAGDTADGRDTFRQTQVRLLGSPLVLSAVLRRPGIGDLGILRREKDPAAWLATNLQVIAPENSDVVQIRLQGDRPDDIRRIVDAVTATYLEDIVERERSDRAAKRETVLERHAAHESVLRDRKAEYDALAEGHDADGPIDDALRDELARRREDIDGLERATRRLGLEAEAVRMGLEPPPPAQLLEAATVGVAR